jgi:hypothetical protein
MTAEATNKYVEAATADAALIGADAGAEQVQFVKAAYQAKALSFIPASARVARTDANEHTHSRASGRESGRWAPDPHARAKEGAWPAPAVVS